MTVPLACPVCRLPLPEAGELRCRSCGRTYATVDGIPVLLGDTSADALQQASHFNDVLSPEWEIERPLGAPPFHRWLLEYKVNQSVDGLRLEGASVAVVCAGSGMDAEMLAARGADVTAFEISLGASRRSRERIRRHGIPFRVVVGDAYALPLADRSVDIAYVHDGLHHLREPMEGVAELARVARRAVVITEPARAAVTRAAVLVGAAETREEAGNDVARLDPAHVAQTLVRLGFTIRRARRYAMFYRHRPRALSRLLSAPIPFLLARGALGGANALLGRFGNKLVIIASR